MGSQTPSLLPPLPACKPKINAYSSPTERLINPSFPCLHPDTAELLWSLGRESQLWDWGDPKREGAAKDCRGAESSETCSE